MQRFKEGNQRRRLRWTEIFAIGGHVAAALQHLADQLIAGKSCRDGVQRRTPLAAFAAESVTIAALFGLKYDGALAFERGAACEQFGWDRRAAPCVHHRRPWSIGAELSQCRQRDYDNQRGQNCEGPATPALLTSARDERQRNQETDTNNRSHNQ